jgi:mevalonate kinase
MSVEFNNAYQEILVDNLVSVIKQNIVFQTQIKLMETNLKEKEDYKKKFEEVNALYNSAKSDLSQLNIYKSKAEQNTRDHDEKNRIQSALNEEMRKNRKLLEENTQLKKYSTQLETVVAPSKLKKIKNEHKVVDQTNVTPKIENKIQKVIDGSGF